MNTRQANWNRAMAGGVLGTLFVLMAFRLAAYFEIPPVYMLLGMLVQSVSTAGSAVPVLLVLHYNARLTDRAAGRRAQQRAQQRAAEGGAPAEPVAPLNPTAPGVADTLIWLSPTVWMMVSTLNWLTTWRPSWRTFEGAVWGLVVTLDVLWLGVALTAQPEHALMALYVAGPWLVLGGTVVGAMLGRELERAPA